MFKIGLCQIKGSFDKTESMKTAERLVKEAAENGAEIISLPEMWNCPYSNDYFAGTPNRRTDGLCSSFRGLHPISEYTS